MLTFLEFYETVLGFVNFKLYSDMNMVYPPNRNNQIDESAGSSLACFDVANPSAQPGKDVSADDRVVSLKEIISELPSEDLEEVNVSFNSAETEADESKRLMSGLIVLISREVTREPVELILRSLGAVVCWSGSGSPFAECDSRITHQIVDRPLEGLSLRANRQYVQPQWVFDSLNANECMPTTEYSPGKPLPPHKSPFVVELKDSVEEDAQKGVDEKQELAKMVMSNKKRKLLERIEAKQRKDKDEAAKLLAKRQTQK
jgi:pescadillo protein